MTKKVKSLFKEKLPNIILFVLLDFLVLILASTFAIWIRFDLGNVPQPFLHNSYQFILIDFLIIFAIYSIFKLYTSVWKYASIIELIDIILANFLFEILTYIYKLIFDISMPRSYYLIEFFLLVMLTCATRLGYRVARTLHIKFENQKKNVKTMLIGAGDAGRMVIDEIYNNSDICDSKIICVVDDDKNKVNHYIKGLKIEGSTKDIEMLADKYRIEEIIIAIPSASKETIDKIVTECHKTGCKIKILPSIYLSMNEKTTSVISQIRPLSYEANY